MWGHLYRFTITNRDLRTNTRGRVCGHAENLEPCKPDYWEADMANGWTPERRARQAEMIRTWKPWETSTGPRTDEGKARTAHNGFKGGTTRGGSRVRESRMLGSVRGALSNGRPYRDLRDLRET